MKIFKLSQSKRGSFSISNGWERGNETRAYVGEWVPALSKGVVCCVALMSNVLEHFKVLRSRKHWRIRKECDVWP
jgi:hypothetical protein